MTSISAADEWAREEADRPLADSAKNNSPRPGSPFVLVPGLPGLLQRVENGTPGLDGLPIQSELFW